MDEMTRNARQGAGRTEEARDAAASRAEARRDIAARRAAAARKDIATKRPTEDTPRKVEPERPVRAPVPPQPRPTLPPPVAPAPPAAVVPPAPSTNPFDTLPHVSAGDRIKADDFNKLSQSLIVIRDAWQLSASLMGHEFGDAKLLLVSQQYSIASVMSVFGHEVADVDDPSLDSRKVIQVVPLELGEKHVAVVVTEAVETRRTVPNLLNLTQAEASERLEGVLGDITIPSDGISAPQLVGLSLQQAKALKGR